MFTGRLGQATIRHRRAMSQAAWGLIFTVATLAPIGLGTALANSADPAPSPTITATPQPPTTALATPQPPATVSASATPPPTLAATTTPASTAPTATSTSAAPPPPVPASSPSRPRNADPAVGARAKAVAAFANELGRAEYLRGVIARTTADLTDVRAQLDTLHRQLDALAALPDAVAAPARLGAEVDATMNEITRQAAAREADAAILQLAVTGGRAELESLQIRADALGKQIGGSAGSPTHDLGGPGSYRGGPLGRPTSGPVTSGFGDRFDPYYKRWQRHAGLDLAAAAGTPIQAAAAGRITQAGPDGGYGNLTCIDHGVLYGQRIETCYAHQAAILVRPAQSVSAGQVIGRVGTTGASTGPHLHLEIRLNGQPVDPMSWLTETVVTDEAHR